MNVKKTTTIYVTSVATLCLRRRRSPHAPPMICVVVRLRLLVKGSSPRLRVTRKRRSSSSSSQCHCNFKDAEAEGGRSCCCCSSDLRFRGILVGFTMRFQGGGLSRHGNAGVFVIPRQSTRFCCLGNSFSHGGSSSRCEAESVVFAEKTAITDPIGTDSPIFRVIADSLEVILRQVSSCTILFYPAILLVGGQGRQMSTITLIAMIPSPS